MHFNLKIRLLLVMLALTLMADAQVSPTSQLLVHNASGLKENVKLKEVRQIFHCKFSRWPLTNNQVTIVLPSSRNGNAAAAARLIYEGSVKDMQKYWLSTVFQGRFNPPIFLDTDAEIVDYVQKNEGAIGVIGLQSADLAKKESIVVIRE